MDQPAFRVSLFRSAVGYRELPASANCRGRNRRTKLAIPLVCDGFREPSDNLAAKFGAGRNCVILHSHELSIQTAEGPVGLPNFYGDRTIRAVDADFDRRYDALHRPNDNHARSQTVGNVVSGALSSSIFVNRSWRVTTPPDDIVYWQSPTVFLHIPKAAGNSVKELFVKGFLKEHRSKQLKGSKTQSLHIDTRREWDLNKKLKKVHLVLYGAFAFGACSSHSKAPCAYYVARLQSSSPQFHCFLVKGHS